MITTQRALTVRRPWANLIVAGHKTVENRTWTPPAGWSGRLVIHAGQAWESAGGHLAQQLGIPGVDPANCPGGYLGTVQVVSVHQAIGDCCAPWGQDGAAVYHWVLSDPSAFPAPIPGRGRLGLYSLPADVVPDDRMIGTTIASTR